MHEGWKTPFLLYFAYMQPFSLNRYTDVSLLFIRLVAALTFLLHGMSKWVLWEDPEQLKPLFQFLSIAEPLCAVGLAFGFFPRSSALGGALVMIAAVWTKIFIWGVGFVDESGIGWEIDMLLLAACVVVIVQGAGKFSVDAILTPKKSGKIVTVS